MIMKRDKSLFDDYATSKVFDAQYIILSSKGDLNLVYDDF
jgi:hypothetical protein